MKTILLVSGDNCKIPTFGYRTKIALEKLGNKVITFNYRFSQLHRFKYGKSILSNLLLTFVKKNNPDIVLVLKGESIEENTIKKISSFGIKVINWTLDDPFGKFSKFNKIPTLLEYDFFFIFDPYYLIELKEQGVDAYYLPCCVDPDIHKEEINFENRNYTYDVSFIGSHQKNRELFLEKLTNFDLHIFGYRWKNSVLPSSSLFKHIHSEQVKADKSLIDVKKMCRIFNESKINLNIHFPHSVESVNLRTFEIPATKSFQLCDNFKELSNLFSIKNEIITYNNESDLKEKIIYYINNPDEAEKISLNSYNRVIKDHTFVNRMEVLLKKIN
jgi:spore maturation protein CgeB